MPVSKLKPSRRELEAEIKRLRHREAFFSATHEIANIGYCDWDNERNCVISCTLKYAQIFGMDIDEVIESQNTWEKVLLQVHPDDRKRYQQSYQSKSSAGSHQIDYRIIRKDGAIRYVREVGVVIPDERGNCNESMGMLQDITELKTYEQDIENKNALAQQVENITDIGHFIWDLKADNYIYISPGFARIHGATVDEYLARVSSQEDDMADVHEDDRERLSVAYQPREENCRELSVEYRILRADGETRWIREQGTYFIEPSRTRELAKTIKRLEQEITERERVSTKLEFQNAELERFAYTVSHDLKAPLVTIKGYIGLLSKDISTQNMERVTDDLGKIGEAADTMGSLLDDLLELSRIGRVMGEPVTCKLSDIAGRAAELVTGKTDPQQLEIVIGDMPSVIGDVTRLTEVYLNLIENAIKFMGEQASPCVQIGANEKDGMAYCFVRDNGCGIDAPYQQKVFNLFERLNAEVDGTGIGLALVKRIVEVHGGRVWVESEGTGYGCSMMFTLPISGLEANSNLKAG
jgi:PAS domain S-box-containing protein